MLIIIRKMLMKCFYILIWYPFKCVNEFWITQDNSIDIIAVLFLSQVFMFTFVSECIKHSNPVVITRNVAQIYIYQMFCSYLRIILLSIIQSKYRMWLIVLTLNSLELCINISSVEKNKIISNGYKQRIYSCATIW